jgi:hypothetical protein
MNKRVGIPDGEINIEHHSRRKAVFLKKRLGRRSRLSLKYAYISTVTRSFPAYAYGIAFFESV